MKRMSSTWKQLEGGEPGKEKVGESWLAAIVVSKKLVKIDDDENGEQIVFQ